MAKVEELLAKHPELTKEEAVKIIAEKNKRKNEKRSEKIARNAEKALKKEADSPNEEEAE